MNGPAFLAVDETTAAPTAGVTINSVSSITGSTALATGTASGTGITERGFFWWNDEQYWGSNASGLIPAGSGAGDFSLNLTNLPIKTQLYVAAYVKVGGAGHHLRSRQFHQHHHDRSHDPDRHHEIRFHGERE